MSIRRTGDDTGYPILEVEHAKARARVALHGAHLVEWTPAGHLPVLYLSPQAVYREGKAIRGGIPICWPWFGPSPDNSELPAHGIARTRFWELLDSSEDDAGVRLQFALVDTPETHALWPHRFRLLLTMDIGEMLHVALRMENTGANDFTVTGALHTYLAVGAISQVTAKGLHGAEYRDATEIPAIRRQDGDVMFDREVDRDYEMSGAVTLCDRNLNRNISIQGTGSQCTVLWNPWIAKTATLKDLPEEAYRHFVCVETANAWRDSIVVAPGASHTLGTTVIAAHL